MSKKRQEPQSRWERRMVKREAKATGKSRAEARRIAQEFARMNRGWYR